MKSLSTTIKKRDMGTKPDLLHSEEYINELVDKYKATGKVEDRDSIVNEFTRYFNKYANILCTNVPVDIRNKDTITFLRLFMSEEDRVNEHAIFIASRNVLSFVRGLFKDTKKEEMYNEVLCYFLEQLDRYKPMIANHKHTKERISFTHFVQVNIRYRLRELIARRQKDALYAGKNVEVESLIDVLEQPSKKSTEETDIDIRWVFGDSSGDIFNKLSAMDRYLLYLKYHKDFNKPLSDYEVARVTGIERMSVRRRFIKIRDKIKQMVDKGDSK